MRIVTPRRAVFAVVILSVLIAAVLVAAPFAHGLTFVIRAADMHGLARRLADLDTVAEHEHVVAIPTLRGSIRARVYEPLRPARRAMLLISGLQPSGIDEPRLMRLARSLAQNNLVIVTPDIPELTQFDITPAITDAIEESALWLASRSEFARDGRIGMMGISFSGGLSIVAAGRPSLAGHVAYVFALGGHDDLARVLRYLCTGQEPYPPHQIRLGPDEGDPGIHVPGDDRFVRPPQGDGVAVVLLGLADRVVPHPQVAPLRSAVRQYLAASARDDGLDKPTASAEVDTVQALTKTLPEPSATLLRHVVDHDVVRLGHRLLPYVGLYASAPALSVSKSPKPSVPVYLLHGTDDNTIPPIESEYLADELRGHAPVRLLLSRRISHPDADRPIQLSDVMGLASFWGDLLSR